MAVIFKGRSEYAKEFRDPKRRQRNPDEEPFAGQGTPNLDMNVEPPFQRKKRFNGFPVSKSSMEPPLQRKKRSDSASPIRQVLEPELQRKKKPLAYKKTAPIATERPSTGNQQDDYMLLGDQSKFNENVKYRIRSRSASERDISRDRRHPRPGSIISHPIPSNNSPQRARPPERPQNPVPPHSTHHKERQSRSRERGPPPRVVVDTGKVGHAMGRGEGGLRLDLGRERAPTQKANGEQGDHDRVFVNQKGILRKSAATQSTPRLLESNGGHRPPSQHTKAMTDVPLKTEKRHRDEERPAKKADEKTSTDKGAKNSAANQQRPTTAANQERPTTAATHPNYAVQYRLGIAPHRSNGPIRFSEYQREFQWRDPIKSSPLISAETVVYKSHPDLTLFRSSSMTEDSEYKAQFKAWNPPPPPPPSSKDRPQKNDPPHPPPPQNRQPSGQPEKPKIRRSKSLKEMPTQPKPQKATALTAATDSNAVMSKQVNSDDGRTHDGQPKKKYRSEYSRNFVAPSNYLYDEGAWKKIHAKENTEPELVPRPSTAPSSASWYAEVLELRRFADDYRKRAQGTHFSREHLAQLYAKNAELWDTLSNESILSSRPAIDDQNRLHPGTSLGKTQKKFGLKATPLLAAVEDISNRSGSITPTGSSYSEAEKENAYPAEKMRPVALQQRKRPHLVHTSADIQGRGVPSSDLKANYSDNEDSSHSYNSDPHEGSSRDSESSGYGHMSKVTRVKGRVSQGSRVKGRVSQVAPSKEDTRNQLHASQLKGSVSRTSESTTTIATHGLPTRDTHVLVTANSNRGREGHQEGYHEGHQESYHEGNQEGRRKTGAAAVHFKNKSVQIDEDDLMSVSSSRSLASSCSLASEVLERARSRRDEFWK